MWRKMRRRRKMGQGVGVVNEGEKNLPREMSFEPEPCGELGEQVLGCLFVRYPAAL